MIGQCQGFFKGSLTGAFVFSRPPSFQPVIACLLYCHSVRRNEDYRSVTPPSTLPGPPPTGEAPVSARGHSILSLVEAALLIDIVVVLCLIRTYIPIPGFQGVIRLFCPAPIVLLVMRRGFRSGAIATTGGYVVLSALVGPLFGTQILVYGLIGMAYGAAARIRAHYLFALLSGAIIYGGYIGFLTVGAPFLLAVFNLHVSPAALIGDIRKQVQSMGHAAGSLHLGPLSLHDVPGLVPLFHWSLNHWVAALALIIAVYGLVNSWAFLFVTQEVLARVDREARVDARGERVDFYPPLSI